MKFLQVAIFAIVLVASAHALSCNVRRFTQTTCEAVDMGPDIDTCWKCVTNAATVYVVSSGCLASSTCASAVAMCPPPSVYTSCNTANCNGCSSVSPASALQISAFLLLAALSALFF